MLNKKVTVFTLTVSDPAYELCKEALLNQTIKNFIWKEIKNVSPIHKASQKMIELCDTNYFIQVDEDMILEPQAIETMVNFMDTMPPNVGMVLFPLWDVDRNKEIFGLKIFRTSIMKNIKWRDRKASDLEILEQFLELGAVWVYKPEILAKHGVYYTIDTIYRRYKTMYEKDIQTFNRLSPDLYEKSVEYQKTGDLLALFAMFGAVHGIITGPYASDKEKDFTQYESDQVLNILRRIILNKQLKYEPYDQTIGYYQDSHPYIHSAWINRLHKIKEFSAERDIFVWGAGKAGIKTVDELIRYGICVKKIVDSDCSKTGKRISNVEIINKDILAQFILKQENKPYIVISSTFADEIKQDIILLGFTKEDYIIKGIEIL